MHKPSTDFNCYPADEALELAVVRLSALGDCLLLLATIQRIQVLRPAWRITWFISRQWVPLFKAIPGLNLVPVDKPRSIFDYLRIARAWRGKSFDVLLCMQASLRANLLYPCFKAKLKLGFDCARAKDGHGWFVNQRITSADEHLLQGFERFADVLGVPRCKPAWHLPLSDQALFSVKRRLLDAIGFDPSDRVMIAISLSASKVERTPYPEFYVSLVALLKAKYDPVIILVGGPSDVESEFARQVYGDLVRTSLQDRVLNWVGQTNLVELAACLKQVNLLIAPDTGPAHLANALNTPVIGLFAVAPPKLSAPYQYQSLVVDQYPAAVEQFLAKQVDEVPFATRVHHRDAMKLIRAEAVLARVRQVL